MGKGYTRSPLLRAAPPRGSNVFVRLPLPQASAGLNAMLEVLVLIVTLSAVGVSVWLTWRAVRTFLQGAQEAAHGATGARRRLWAYRMRISTLTGVAAVGLGVLAVAQHELPIGRALWLSVGLLVFGALAYTSAQAAGRASQRGDKREHIRARLRFMRQRRRAQHEQRGKQHGRTRSEGRSSQGRRRRSSPPRRDTKRQQEVRRALRTLGLGAGATDDEVKQAWREQAFRHHPDRHPSDSEDASREEHAEAFLRAQRAYETLTRRAEP